MGPERIAELAINESVSGAGLCEGNRDPWGFRDGSMGGNGDLSSSSRYPKGSLSEELDGVDGIFTCWKVGTLLACGACRGSDKFELDGGSIRRRLVGGGRVPIPSTPSVSKGRGGPCKKVATALEAVARAAARDISSSSNSSSKPSRARRRFSPDVGPLRLGFFFVFPFDGFGMVSRRLVYEPSERGGSMSMSERLTRSMITSPDIEKPGIPYPPALTDGERPCLEQNMTTLCNKIGE